MSQFTQIRSTPKQVEELQLFEDSFFTLSTESAQDSLAWSISEPLEEERTGVVDGKVILARVSGPAFAVDGVSQNRRFYERKLWERVIRESQPALQSRTMFGSIGHGANLDDQGILEGKVSHIITKLWIDEHKKIGMLEYVVLNTPSGQILNTLLRAGTQVPVSSRGFGKFNGTRPDGMQIVDSDSYKLEGFDIVRTPGIAHAIPQLVEAMEDDEDKPSEEESRISEIDHQDTSNEKSTHRKMSIVLEHEGRQRFMDENLVLQKMTEEKVALEQDLHRALDANFQLQETNNALRGQVDEMQKTIKSYRQLGSISELNQVMDVTESIMAIQPGQEAELSVLREQLTLYEEFGTLEELGQVFAKFEEYMNRYDELGKPGEIDEALEQSALVMETYRKFGRPQEIKEAFDVIEVLMHEMGKLGTLDELHAVCDLLEAYQAFGTPSELAQSFSMMENVIRESKKRYLQTESQTLAKNYGIDHHVAEELVQRMGAAKARNVLSTINEGRTTTDRYKINSDTEKLYENAGQTKSPKQSAAKVIGKNRTVRNRVGQLFENVNR